MQGYNEKSYIAKFVLNNKAIDSTCSLSCRYSKTTGNALIDVRGNDHEQNYDLYILRRQSETCCEQNYLIEIDFESFKKFLVFLILDYNKFTRNNKLAHNISK